MDPRSRGILDAALELPEPARATISQTLWETSTPPAEVMTEDEFAADLFCADRSRLARADCG
jgi:hypothetical protein